MFPHCKRSAPEWRLMLPFPPLPASADHPKSLIVTCDPLGTLTPGRHVKALAGPGKLAWAGHGPVHATAEPGFAPGLALRLDYGQDRTCQARLRTRDSGHS